MPPGHHSSSSHSSHSHSSSHHSSSHSSHSHSSSSHSSSSRSYSSGSSYSRPKQPTIPKDRIFIPSGAPAHIKENSVHIQCKTHRYIYYKSDWTDETTSKAYQRGYYDENGRHYDVEELTFRNIDGSYTAHFTCEYCGNETDLTWKEGEYPHCSNCGAIMNKNTIVMDDLVAMTKATTVDQYTSNYHSSYSGSSNSTNSSKLIVALILAIVVLPMIVQFVGAIIIMTFAGIGSLATSDSNDRPSTEYTYKTSDEIGGEYKGTPSNVDIYGRTIYLDLVDEENNIYVICDESDEYEKKLSWDYGYDSYYDRDSNCYVWYNT